MVGRQLSSQRSLFSIHRNQGVDHPVEVVKEGEEVEAQLDPALLHGPAQLVGIHDARRVIEPRHAHDGTGAVPESTHGI